MQDTVESNGMGTVLKSEPIPRPIPILIPYIGIPESGTNFIRYHSSRRRKATVTSQWYCIIYRYSSSTLLSE